MFKMYVVLGQVFENINISQYNIEYHHRFICFTLKKINYLFLNRLKAKQLYTSPPKKGMNIQYEPYLKLARIRP